MKEYRLYHTIFKDQKWDDCELVFVRPETSDPEADASFWAKLMGIGVTSVNEVRKEFKMEPLKDAWADLPFDFAKLLFQPATAPVPGAGPQPPEAPLDGNHPAAVAADSLAHAVANPPLNSSHPAVAAAAALPQAMLNNTIKQMLVAQNTLKQILVPKSVRR
jgi:hypothetical protein